MEYNLNPWVAFKGHLQSGHYQSFQVPHLVFLVGRSHSGKQAPYLDSGNPNLNRRLIYSHSVPLSKSLNLSEHQFPHTES